MLIECAATNFDMSTLHVKDKDNTAHVCYLCEENGGEYIYRTHLIRNEMFVIQTDEFYKKSIFCELVSLHLPKILEYRETNVLNNGDIESAIFVKTQMYALTSLSAKNKRIARSLFKLADKLYKNSQNNAVKLEEFINELEKIDVRNVKGLEYVYRDIVKINTFLTTKYPDETAYWDAYEAYRTNFAEDRDGNFILWNTFYLA